MPKTHIDRHEDHFILSLGRKLAYGIGGVPVMLFTSGATQIALIFNVVFKLDALLVGMVFLVPRIWDAISDPLMGNISDNTRSKWGRRRPYILVGGLFAAFLYFLMLSPPSSWSRPLTNPLTVVELAAEINETPVERLDEGMRQLAATIQQADGGGNAAAEDLNALGIAYDALADMNAGDQFLTVVSAIANLEDGTRRAALAGRLLGRSGKELLPVLNLGGERFDELLGQARGPLQTRMLGFLLVTSVLFFTAFTVFIVPYFALGMEMSLDYHERTRIQGYREFFASFGVIAAYWGLWFITRPFFPSDIVGARIFGLLVAGLAAVTVIYVVRGTSEAGDVQEQEKIGFIEALKITFSNRQFLILAAAMLSFQLGLFAWVSLQAYVNLYHVFSGDLEKGSMMVGVNATVFHLMKLLAVAPIIWVGTKLGKGRAFGIGISLTALAFGLTWVAYTPIHPYWQLALQLILVWCLPTADIFPNSITADICDLDELETGRRREGVFGACLAFARKTGTAAVPLIVGFGLTISGFDENLGTQPTEVLTRMRLVTIIVPILFVILSGLLFLAVRVPEAKIREARKILEERRRQKGVSP